jgi:hypothetical protein
VPIRANVVLTLELQLTYHRAVAAARRGTNFPRITSRGALVAQAVPCVLIQGRKQSTCFAGTDGCFSQTVASLSSNTPRHQASKIVLRRVPRMHARTQAGHATHVPACCPDPQTVRRRGSAQPKPHIDREDTRQPRRLTPTDAAIRVAPLQQRVIEQSRQTISFDDRRQLV